MAKFTGKSCKCTTPEQIVHTKAEQKYTKVYFSEETGEIWTVGVGVVSLVILACVLRATTEKWSSTLGAGVESAPQRKSWLRLRHSALFEVTIHIHLFQLWDFQHNSTRKQ